MVSPIGDAFNLFFGIGMVVFALIYERPIRRSLKDIRRGNFDRKGIVRSNDEIGYTGDVINQMATE